MNKKTKFKFSLLITAVLLGHSAAFADPQAIKVSVKGMVCGFCAQGIKKKFTAEPAVEQVSVTLDQGKYVDLKMREGQSLSDQQIEKVIKESGFSVEKIERK